jgi:hypothetical protein
MSSIDDKTIIDEFIAENGSDGITHIIEYQNQFDGRTAWKLCNSKEMYEYVMETGSFIEPKLIWTQEDKFNILITSVQVTSFGQRSRLYSDGRNEWRRTAIKCAGSEVLYIQGQKPWSRLNKKKEEMMRCAVYSKDSDSLKKHRKKMPHYRKNSKPSLVQKLLGRSEFTKISND